MKRLSIGLAAVASACLIGCATLSGMVVGSKAWFEKQKPELTATAATDLGCQGQPIEFAPVNEDEYREVEARGCSKKVRYQHTKIGPVESWRKASEPAPM